MTTKIHLRSGIVCAVTLAVAYGCAQPAERTQQPTQPESESIDEVIVQGTRAPRSTRQRAADRREAKRAREDAELGSIIVTGSRVASNGVIGSPYADYVGIPVPYPQQTNRENYAEIDANPVHRAIAPPI